MVELGEAAGIDWLTVGDGFGGKITFSLLGAEVGAWGGGSFALVMVGATGLGVGIRLFSLLGRGSEAVRMCRLLPGDEETSENVSDLINNFKQKPI